MPGPLDAFERIDTLPGNPPPPLAEPPPPIGPPTGFMENLRAGFTGAKLTGRSVSEMDIVRDGYAPILDELNRGRHGGIFTESSALGRLTGSEDTRFDNPGMIRDMAPLTGGESERERAEARIFAEIRRRRQTQPEYLKGVPDSPDEFRAQIYARAAAHAAELARIQSRATFGGRIGGFLGGAGGMMDDPLAVATLPVGGFGRTVARRVLTEGLTQAGVAAVQQPGVAEVHAKLGMEYTAGDAAFNILAAGAGGVIFRGALVEPGAALGRAMGRQLRTSFPEWARQRDADAFGRAMQRATKLGSFSKEEMPSVAARLMSPDFGIVSADAARAQLRREIEAGTIDDRAVAEHFRLAVPDEMRTPEEKAALAGIGVEADLAESSPYRPGPAGDLAHQENFAAAVRRLLDPSTGPGQAAHVDAAGVPRATPKALGVVLHPNDLVRFVINDLEGGAKVVHYGEADGGTTKYGIAQRDHPGVDVANLTEDQAAAIARRKYWLPEFYDARPDVAPIAFDAYFIHGDPKFARRLAAMDDPAQALRAYRAMLNHIADTVPGKAKYRKGWNARLDKLGRKLGIEDAPFAPPELRPAVAADEPGVEIVDRESLAAAAGPEEDAAGALRRQVGEALAAARPVAIEDGFGSRRIVAVSEEGLVDEHGAIVRPEEIAAPEGDPSTGSGQGARVLLGREPPPPVEVQPKAPPRRSGPVHLLQAIADAGGLRDDEGHDLIKGRNIPRFVPGAGTIVRRESGLSVDAMGEHLWEQGWFGPPSTSPRPSENDVLQLLERGVREKLYRPEDQAAAAERAAARDAMPEDDARDELASHAEEHGLHLDDRTLDEALAHRAAGETVEGAVARAVHDAAWRDTRGGVGQGEGGLDRLDEEEANGWQAQVDGIEHDLRMDAAAEAPAPRREHAIPEQAAEPIATLVDATEGGRRARAKGQKPYYDALTGHPAYAEAKAGDVDAARRVVRELVTPENIEAARAHAGAIFVPVLAEERTGRNAIPLALADHYAAAAGGTLETRIVQSVRANHTGAAGVQRLARRARFDGPVEAGARYVLVDDVGTMGGTIAELADHIQRNGGVVERVVLLANGAGKLAPEAELVRAIEEKGLGDVVRESFGLEPRALTRAEAQWVLRRGSADRLRADIAAGLGGEGGGAPAGAAGGGGGGGLGPRRVGEEPALYRVGEGDASLADILDRIDREREGASALRACMVPKGGAE